MTRRSFPGLAALLAGVLVAAACTDAGAAGGEGAGQGGVDANGCPTSEPAALGAGETRTVAIVTELGTMELEIKADLSPIAAGNFVALAECGWYDGVVFHRVVPGFVIQAGDGENGRSPNVNPALVGSGGPGYTITDEPVIAPYGRGVVAMARTSRPNSVGSQFFIVLDGEAQRSLGQANTYQIIGSVTSGMEVADAITAAADAEIPSRPVVMTDVTVSNP
ncbi:MAG: peptidylprolyl isomerase [Candidatus Limnocylindrales bacterium]